MCLEYDKESHKYKLMDAAASQLGGAAAILCNPGNIGVYVYIVIV